MDKRTKEDLRQQAQRVQYDAQKLAEHLAEVGSAINGPDWETIWAATHRQNMVLRQLVPGLISLGKRLVSILLDEFVEQQPPHILAEYTSNLLRKYLNIRVGVFEHVYPQLSRAASEGLHKPMDAEMRSLLDLLGQTVMQYQSDPSEETVRQLESLELVACVFKLVYDNTASNRQEVRTAFGALIERLDVSTALEFLTYQE